MYELLNCKIYCYLFLINIIYSLPISNLYTMHYDCPHHPSSSAFLLLSSNTFLQKFLPGTLMSFSFVLCPAEFNQDCDVGNPSGSGWADRASKRSPTTGQYADNGVKLSNGGWWTHHRVYYWRQWLCVSYTYIRSQELPEKSGLMNTLPPPPYFLVILGLLCSRKGTGNKERKLHACTKT